MQFALLHAIIRTRRLRFGPDVLDPPLNEISFCPWCGSQWTNKEASFSGEGLSEEEKQNLIAKGWYQTSGPSGITEWWHPNYIGWREL